MTGIKGEQLIFLTDLKQLPMYKVCTSVQEFNCCLLPLSTTVLFYGSFAVTISVNPTWLQFCKHNWIDIFSPGYISCTSQVIGSHRLNHPQRLSVTLTPPRFQTSVPRSWHRFLLSLADSDPGLGKPFCR